LPEIIQEIRSNSEDAQYYDAAVRKSSPDRRTANRTGYADDAAGSPLVELGKIMGTLQLDDGQVNLP